MTEDRSKHLARVRGLLAKAESTPYPAEAEACVAKAQELMSRYSIDETMLASSRPANVDQRDLDIPDPYAGPKFSLLSAVARANRAEAVFSRQERVATVFGSATDLDAVELLFTSLLRQATTAMLSHQAEGAVTGGRTKSFRHSFLVAFAVRIGRRLAEEAEAAERRAVEEHGDRLLPVLVAQREAVEQAVERAFPFLRRSRTVVHNAAGWAAGTAAANAASLGTRREVRRRAG